MKVLAMLILLVVLATSVAPALAQEQTPDQDVFPNCIRWSTAWNSAPSLMGKFICIYGTVSSTYDSGRAFFVNFTYDRSSLYVVSFDYLFYNMKNECVLVSGKLASYRGRPQIIVDYPEQVGTCDGYALPSCQLDSTYPCWEPR